MFSTIQTCNSWRNAGW